MISASGSWLSSIRCRVSGLQSTRVASIERLASASSCSASRIWRPKTELSSPEPPLRPARFRSEEHTSELQSHLNLVCRLLLEKKKKIAVTLIDHLHVHVYHPSCDSTV